MELTININKKTYTMPKLIRKRSRIFDEAFEKVDAGTKGTVKNDNESLDIIEDALVGVYDNQFTKDEIEENMDEAEILAAFMSIYLYREQRLLEEQSNISENFMKKNSVLLNIMEQNSAGEQSQQ